LISLALPITDTLLSILRRFLAGHSLFGADREHIHHKLLALGLNHRQAVWILYAVSATGALLSLFLLQYRLLVPVVGIFGVILFFGLRKLNYREFAEFGRLWRRACCQKMAFERNIALRKAIAELQKTSDITVIYGLLERGLCSDFAFELELSKNVLGVTHRRPVPKSMNLSRKANTLLRLDLSTSRSAVLGCLWLELSNDDDWLLDVELVTRDLRFALSTAIENWIQCAPFRVSEELRRFESFPQLVDVTADAASATLV
jgi:hypothetical protein